MAQDHATAEAIRAAQGVLDAFMTAFNARDTTAFEQTFNFPSVRLASQGLVIIKAGDMKPERFNEGALAEWDHSAWDRREVIHAGPDSDDEAEIELADDSHLSKIRLAHCQRESIFGGFPVYEIGIVFFG